MAEAGIERSTVFVTNAVKHFKFEPRGKRRLHKQPSAYEIDRCHWWLDIERMLVKPEIIVALGATAMRSVSGRPLPINKIRGRVMPLGDGGQMLATVHPSYILRIEDDADKRAQYKQFVSDLKGLRKGSRQGRLIWAVNNSPAGSAASARARRSHDTPRWRR